MKNNSPNRSKVGYLSAVFLASAITLPSTSSAVALLDGFGGDAGYGELAMPRNDDSSSNQLPLPFAVNFFGTTYNNFFINNNGNITFNSRLGSFTPRAFPVANQPMIAPFWGDVDTRCSSCGEVYIAAPNDSTVAVTWNNVGFYSSNSSLTNNFQLVLRDQGNGDFDVDFRYDRLEWTTGNASNGTNGLGGIPAQAGYDAGNQTNFFALPGSLTADVLELQNTSNVSAATPGLWSFAIRDGALPGETPENPLMPVTTDAGFDFDFDVVLNETVFIDPIVAVGYDYIVNSGPLFASVTLPVGIGDDSYDLLLWDLATSMYVDAGTLTGGIEHFFAAGGIDRFRILGIEASELLDPADATAFVTGLSFASTGRVNVSQNPITFDTDPAQGPIPEPTTWMLLSGALLGFGAMRKRKLNS